jgi:hypothetical protein
MTAVDFPFYLFFGIMGLVAGGLIVWLLMAERAFEIGEVRGGPVDEAEAPLLVCALAEDGHTVDEATVQKLLELHDAYFDGRIRDSLAAAENARLEAERVRLAADRVARREAQAAQAAQAAAAAASGAAVPARPPRRRRTRQD